MAAHNSTFPASAATIMTTTTTTATDADTTTDTDTDTATATSACSSSSSFATTATPASVPRNVCEGIVLVKSQFAEWRKLAHKGLLPYMKDIGCDWDLQVHGWLQFDKDFEDALAASTIITDPSEIVYDDGHTRAEIFPIKSTLKQELEAKLPSVLANEAAAYVPTLQFYNHPQAGMCVGTSVSGRMCGATSIPPWRWLDSDFILKWTPKGAVLRDPEHAISRDALLQNRTRSTASTAATTSAVAAVTNATAATTSATAVNA